MAFRPYREEEAAKQIERLNRVRAGRDEAGLRGALDAVEDAAREGRNVMPAVMDAVELHATVGEVCGVLKAVFGMYEEPVRF